MVQKKKHITKTQIARELQVSRQSLYYKHKQEPKDEQLKEQVLQILSIHPSYGYRRVAIALNINKKRAQRVMRKYKIRPYKRKQRWKKRRDLRRKEMPYTNLIKDICPIQSRSIYASDFTYLRYKKKYYYLATLIDIHTREIVGWDISKKHDTYMVLRALINSFYNTDFQIPEIIHSDQGSEYCSKEYINMLKTFGIQISMSKKSSPWENGYQEGFYSNFKTDLGIEFDRFNSIGEFIEGIHQMIHYYNTERIHTALKMTPSAYAKLHTFVKI